MKCSELAAEINTAASILDAAERPEEVFGLTASDLADIVRHAVDNYSDMDGVWWKGVGKELLASIIEARAECQGVE